MSAHSRSLLVLLQRTAVGLAEKTEFTLPASIALAGTALGISQEFVHEHIVVPFIPCSKVMGLLRRYRLTIATETVFLR